MKPQMLNDKGVRHQVCLSLWFITNNVLIQMQYMIWPLAGNIVGALYHKL